MLRAGLCATSILQLLQSSTTLAGAGQAGMISIGPLGISTVKRPRLKTMLSRKRSLAGTAAWAAPPPATGKLRAPEVVRIVIALPLAAPKRDSTIWRRERSQRTLNSGSPFVGPNCACDVVPCAL